MFRLKRNIFFLLCIFALIVSCKPKAGKTETSKNVSPEYTQEKDKEKPSVKPNEKPSVEPNEKPSVEPNEKPPVESNEKPPVEPNEKPSVEPNEKPPVEPNEKPSVEPNEKPPVEPNEKPPVESNEKPPVESNEKPPVEPEPDPEPDPELPTIDESRVYPFGANFLPADASPVGTHGYINYIPIPQRLVESVKANPSQYLPFDTWISTGERTLNSFFRLPNRYQYSIDFRDATRPSLSTLSVTNGNVVQFIPDLTRNGRSDGFAHWSTSDDDIREISDFYPAFAVQPREAFSLLLIFYVERTTSDGKIEYYYHPMNLESLEKLAYTMES